MEKRRFLINHRERDRWLFVRYCTYIYTVKRKRFRAVERGNRYIVCMVCVTRSAFPLMRKDNIISRGIYKTAERMEWYFFFLVIRNLTFFFFLSSDKSVRKYYMGYILFFYKNALSRSVKLKLYGMHRYLFFLILSAKKII